MALFWPKKNKLFGVGLILIMLLGLALRAVAVKPGYFTHGDELMFGQAIYMLTHGTLGLESQWLGYPPLVAWIMLVFFVLFFIPGAWLIYFLKNFQDLLAQFGGMYQTTNALVFNLKNIFAFHILGRDWVNALYWGRYVTAIFGAGAIFLTYKVTVKLAHDKTAGLLAALAAAVNYRLVLSSHIGFIDMYNVFFLLLAFWAILELISQPNPRTYLLAWIAVALSFLTKYQIYGLVPLFCGHLFVVFSKVKSQKENFLKAFLSREVILGGLVALTLVVLAHGYHFLYIESIKEINAYQAAKYSFGRNIFDIFPISYLFYVGIGPVLSWLGVAGVVLALCRKASRLPALILLSPLPGVVFLYMFYTGGGFYTRNIIVLIPLGLVFAAQAFACLRRALPRLLQFLLILLFLFSLKDHLINSLTLDRWYSQPATVTRAKNWIEKNISGPVVFGTDYPVLIPSDKQVVNRSLPNVDVAFSYLELLKEGYDKVVVDISSLHSNYLIWWMRQSTRIGLKFWRRPDNLLSQNYKVLSLRELLWEHNLATFFTSWQAPGFNLAVFDISTPNPCQKVDYIKYLDGKRLAWTPLNFLPEYQTNLARPESPAAGLVKIKAGNFMMGAVRWQTEAFSVEGGRCYGVAGQTSFEGKIPKEERGAFLRLDFYSEPPQLNLLARPLISFVSERAYGQPNFTLVVKALAPTEAKYAAVGFQVDGSVHDFTLKNLQISQAVDKLDLPPPPRVILEDKYLFLPNNEGIL